MCAPLRIADLQPESFARFALAAVSVTMVPNQPPTVSLISPLANANTIAPGSFTLTANASSATSSIAKVVFYNGTTLLGTATTAPYSFSWSNIPLGTYSITAKATDTLNAATTSNAVTVTVNTGVVQAYYIHADQLDTPRAITDTNGIVVWQWDNVDPFGNNMANENPAGAGAFSFNLRFPGQYFDRETNTHYNINRDYDAAIGRYIESDPIGLAGGINTYAYVGGNPLSKVDPSGLAGMAVYFSGYQVDTGLGFSLPLGHAGVVAIDNKTGATQYFDFGRYGGQYGDVRGPFDVGIVSFDKSGMPTQASMDAINKTMSDAFGKGTSPSSVYNGDADANKIIEFSLDRQKNVSQYPYTINPFSKNKFNVCDTFAKDALGAGSK